MFRCGGVLFFALFVAEEFAVVIAQHFVRDELPWHDDSSATPWQIVDHGQATPLVCADKVGQLVHLQ